MIVSNIFKQSLSLLANNVETFFDSSLPVLEGRG